MTVGSRRGSSQPELAARFARSARPSGGRSSRHETATSLAVAHGRRSSFDRMDWSFMCGTHTSHRHQQKGTASKTFDPTRHSPPVGKPGPDHAADEDFRSDPPGRDCVAERLDSAVHRRCFVRASEAADSRPKACDRPGRNRETCELQLGASDGHVCLAGTISVRSSETVVRNWRDCVRRKTSRRGEPL